MGMYGAGNGVFAPRRTALHNEHPGRLKSDTNMKSKQFLVHHATMLLQPCFW